MKRLNMNQLVKIALLTGFAAFFILVSTNGLASMYVHPALVPMLIACAAVFLIIAALAIPGALNGQVQDPFKMSYLMFIIPLLLAFAVPPTAENGNAAAASHTVAVNTSNQNQANAGRQNDESSLDGSRVIDMNDHDFMRWMDEFYNNTDQYTGREVELTAFIFRDESCGPDQFIAARYVMVCCAADLQLCGITCRYGDQAEYDAETWVKIRGRLEKDGTSGDIKPLIEVESIEKVEKPKEEYVYFLYSWE